MNHDPVSAVNPHMADWYARIVCTCKKDNIPRLCICRRHRRTLVINALCCGSWQVMDTAVCKYPADKTGTVKAGGRTGASPYIGIVSISRRFFHKCLHGCIVIGIRRYHISSAASAARRFAIQRIRACFKIKKRVIIFPLIQTFDM